MTNTTNQYCVGHDDLGADSGEPALLYMTGLGADRSVWRPTAEASAARRRSITMDWRRHGTNPPGPHDYGWDDLLDDALGVLEHLAVDQVVPVAGAHGGWVAYQLARRRPHRVPAVVLVSWMTLGAPPPFLAALADVRDPTRSKQAVTTLTEGWTRGHEDVPGLVALVERMRGNGSPAWSHASALVGAAFARHGSPTAAFSRLDPPVPTLHLYAQPPDDGYLAAQQAFARDNPWFHVQRLDEARTHFPMLEAPGQIAGRVEQFLAEHATAPTTA